VVEFIVNLARAALVMVRESADVVRHNISLGILSIALAVTLWYFVIDVESESRTDFFTGRVPVEAVNVSQALAVAGLSEPSVSVRITADEDIWDDLSIDDFQATVDLSGISQREASIPVRVSVDRGDIRVVDVDPPRVTVTLEPVMTKTVPVSVKLVGVASQGYSLSESEVSLGRKAWSTWSMPPWPTST
jgi:YbbR domain-containing protein